MSDTTVKEVLMDVPQEGKTRKRRAGGRRRKSRVADDADTTIVTKDHTAPSIPVTTKPASAPAPIAGAAAKPTVAPKVVLAPPKPKVPKVLLIPKGKTTQTHSRPVRKTFKAKQLKVIIDNSAKTQKRRSTMMTKVDEMTDDQIRAAAVHARLSRRETVAKAPINLLRQMVKDYQIMKGRLL
jgi:hypothetical protein